MAARLRRLFIIVLAMLMLVACNDGGTGGSGACGSQETGAVSTAGPEMGCLQVKYWRISTGVEVELWLNGQNIRRISLCEYTPVIDFNESYLDCGVYGAVAYWKKTATQNGRLAITVTVSQGGEEKKYQDQTIAEW